MNRFGVVSIVAGCALGLSSCGISADPPVSDGKDVGDDAPADPPAPDTTMPTAPTVELDPAPDLGSGFSARGLLAEIPAPYLTDVWAGVSGADFALISEVSGVERTGSVDASDPPTDWTSLLFSPEPDGVHIPYSQLLSASVTEPESFEEELGFGLLDMDRFVSVTNFLGSDPDDLNAFPYDVVALRETPMLLADGVGSDGIVGIGEGEDGERDLESRTPLRPIGRPLRVGVDEERSVVSLSFSTAIVAAWLDLDRGRDVVAGAAGNDLFAAASSLDLADDLYAVDISTHSRSTDDFDAEAMQDRSSSEFLIVEPFETLGIGWSGIAETQRTSIVYVFADERAAAASVDPIDELYRSDDDLGIPDARGLDGVVTIGDVLVVDEVRVVGRTVLVTAHSAPGRPPGDIDRLLGEFATPLIGHA